jgi:hypothetical protein
VRDYSLIKPVLRLSFSLAIDISLIENQVN